MYVFVVIVEGVERERERNKKKGPFLHFALCPLGLKCFHVFGQLPPYFTTSKTQISIFE
jgi:hypothetical protein